MQPNHLERISRILKALTNPASLRIVLLLAQQGPLSVQQIYTRLATEQGQTSTRLIKLANLGVVIRRGRYASTRYELADPSAVAVAAVLTLGQKTLPVLPPSRQKRRFGGCAVMTKQDVINQISHRTGQDPIAIRAVIESFFGVVKHNLAQGESIYVRGFGSFIPLPRAAKLARNISQKTAHPIEAHTIPAFKPSTEFKDQVRNRPVTADQ